MASCNIKGYLCILAGVLINFFNGCFYLWANISVYVLSYIYHFDKEVDQNAIFYVDVALVLLMTMGYQVGSYLLNIKRINPKLIIFMGGTISLTGIFLSTFTHSLGMFVFFYGVFSGIGVGMMYMIPLVCGWEHFPERKGLITGIIIGAYGLGNFIFSQISTRIINTDNANATIFINEDLSYFEWDVASRVPYCLRIMCIIWAVQIAVGIILISRPKEPDEDS